MKRNIYLVGFMGTGKTTIGRELARVMGRKFVDVDLELERRLGMTVNQVFELHGEPYFRNREKELAMELAGVTRRVVATGGGTILDPEIYEAFQRTGLLICLYTERDNLVSRLKRTDKRPLLKAPDPHEVEQKVDRLMEERRAIYGKVKIRLDTTDLTPMAAARKIHDLLSMRQKALEELQSQYIELQ
ncbi:MAG: shikimate kinase [Armatimonadetes bacterium]|nr:shikimate kinase [Armatimonadota bacterium]